MGVEPGFSAVQTFTVVTILTTVKGCMFSWDEVEEFGSGLLPGADPVPVWCNWEEPQKFAVRMASLRDKIRYMDLQNMKQKFSSLKREFNAQIKIKIPTFLHFKL